MFTITSCQNIECEAGKITAKKAPLDIEYIYHNFVSHHNIVPLIVGDRKPCFKRTGYP
jgi:hypothetical protein